MVLISYYEKQLVSSSHHTLEFRKLNKNGENIRWEREWGRKTRVQTASNNYRISFSYFKHSPT